MAESTRVPPQLLERVLQREAVDAGGEHAHVVGARPVHAGGGALHAAEDVAAADDDGALDAGVLQLDDLFGDARERGGMNAVLLISHQRLPGDLEEDPLVAARLDEGAHGESWL
jgi:hypothetical protein